MAKKRSFSYWLLLILAFEKFIQHMFVTYALITDLGRIRQQVSLDFRLFLISGFLVGILFLVAFFLLLRRNPLSLSLLRYLALFDFIGEFVAQGTIFITITVSFLVATLILILLRLKREELRDNMNLLVQAGSGS